MTAANNTEFVVPTGPKFLKEAFIGNRRFRLEECPVLLPGDAMRWHFTEGVPVLQIWRSRGWGSVWENVKATELPLESTVRPLMECQRVATFCIRCPSESQDRKDRSFACHEHLVEMVSGILGSRLASSTVSVALHPVTNEEPCELGVE